MKKGKLLSLLLAAVVGAGSLAMTAQAAPAELPAQTAKTAAFVKASDWVLKDDWAIFALGRNQEAAKNCMRIIIRVCWRCWQIRLS